MKKKKEKGNSLLNTKNIFDDRRRIYIFSSSKYSLFNSPSSLLDSVSRRSWCKTVHSGVVELWCGVLPMLLLLLLHASFRDKFHMHVRMYMRVRYSFIFVCVSE